MATGIIGTMASNATLRYTPASDAKVSVTGTYVSTGSNITINGFSYQPVPYIPTVVFFAAANQLITITTSSTVSAIVSSLESV